MRSIAGWAASLESTKHLFGLLQSVGQDFAFLAAHALLRVTGYSLSHQLELVV